MSSQVLPKEGQTAFQRWELRSLDAPARGGRAAGRLPTASEVEQVHRAAHMEGYAAGLAEGRAEAAAQAARLRLLVESMTQELRAGEAQVAEDLLSLALELARCMARDALKVRRELILPVVREAMQQMPLYGAPARLLLHPQDAAQVTGAMAEQLQQLGWRLVEDAQIAPGGCRVESASTSIDATLPTRWQRLAAGLGRDASWLEGEAPQPPGAGAEDPA
jgi:flagellar assembly protein FliH